MIKINALKCFKSMSYIVQPSEVLLEITKVYNEGLSGVKTYTEHLTLTRLKGIFSEHL